MLMSDESHVSVALNLQSILLGEDAGVAQSVAASAREASDQHAHRTSNWIIPQPGRPVNKPCCYMTKITVAQQTKADFG